MARNFLYLVVLVVYDEFGLSLFIDFMIYNCYLKDVEGLTKQSEEGARFGFTGKQVRYNQIIFVEHPVISVSDTVRGLFPHLLTS